MIFGRKKRIISVLLILFVFLAAGCINEIPKPVPSQDVNAVRLYPGENRITVPDGKALYVFAANIPELYNNRKSVEKFTVTGSDYRTGYRSGSRALIPESKSVFELMQNREDVWFFKFNSNGKQDYCKSDMTYLTIGKEIVYYSQSDLSDGVNYQVIAELLDEMIGDSPDDSEHMCILQREREMMGLSGYDVDYTGYFHILFTDFGEFSITADSGVAGAYDPSQIRRNSIYNPNSNEADMFFINTRYVVTLYNAYGQSADFQDYIRENWFKIVAKYGSPENFLYAQVAYNVAGTLIHEYCHCLMDCNRYLNGGRTLSGSLFWIEGTANIVPYAMCGDFQDPSAVMEWIGRSESYNPAFNSYDSDSAEYANYGAGPLFFGYVLAKYGEDVFKSVLRYNKERSEDIRDVVRDCTGKSFETVYRDFLLEMISSCEGMGVKIGNSSGQCNFIKDWGFTLEAVERASGITKVNRQGDVVYGDEKYITKSKRNFRTDLNQLGWVLIKWEGSPSVLNVTGDVLCYALFV